MYAPPDNPAAPLSISGRFCMTVLRRYAGFVYLEATLLTLEKTVPTDDCFCIGCCEAYMDMGNTLAGDSVVELLCTIGSSAICKSRLGQCLCADHQTFVEVGLAATIAQLGFTYPALYKLF